MSDRKAPRVELDLGRALDRCGNVFGRLPPHIQDLLQVLIESPSQESWDDAHGIILRSAPANDMTLWNAIIAVDPTFPAEGKRTRGGYTDPKTGERIPEEVLRPWPRVPEPDLVIRAIYYAGGGCPPGTSEYLVRRRPEVRVSRHRRRA